MGWTRREFLWTTALAAGSIGVDCGSDRSPRYGLYLDDNVVVTGETPVVRVSATAPTAELRIVDAVADEMVWSGTLASQVQTSPDAAYLGADWSRAFELPALGPGCYAVSISRELVPEPGRFEANETYLYVRESDSGNPVLLVTDSPTSQAYNDWGGASFYTTPYTTAVSRLRPGVAPRVLRNTPRIARLLDELDRGWDAVDTETVARDPSLLARYDLVVLVGQAEYVSRPFRDALEGYYEAGGRLLMLGNELLLYQTRRIDDLVICHKYPHVRPRDPIEEHENPEVAATASYAWVRSDDETRFVGVSSWLAGKPGVEVPWTVHRADHWLWQDTGLGEGDAFTTIRAQQIVDGTLIRMQNGLPVPDQTERTGTPEDFLLMATAPIVDARLPWLWADDPTIGANQVAPSLGWGAMGLRQNAAGGGMLVVPDVRLVPTSAWSGDPRIQQMVANAIRALLDRDDLSDGY